MKFCLQLATLAKFLWRKCLSKEKSNLLYLGNGKSQKAQIWWSTSLNLSKIFEIKPGKKISDLNALLNAKPGHGFWSSFLRHLCPTKSSFFEKFWWRNCMWFVVCLPPTKNSGNAYVKDVHKRCRKSSPPNWTSR